VTTAAARLEIVAVAMDTNGIEPRPVDRCREATYPQLIDAEHSLGALLGIINVPMGVWIDEDGVLVRRRSRARAARARLWWREAAEDAPSA